MKYLFLNNIINLHFNQKIDILFLKQILPGIVIFDKKEHTKKYNIININVVDTHKYKIKYNNKNLSIYCEEEKLTKEDLIHLLYSYLKYIFFKKDIYFVHSCLIENNLYIGHTGVGKTSLCIYAIKNNLDVFSFDRTCVKIKNNKIIPLSCTDVLSARKKLNNSFLFNKNVSFQNSTKDRFIYKYNKKLDLNDIQINKILFFEINKDNRAQHKISNPSLTHQLYPFFNDFIKNDTIVCNGKLIFSPTYNEKYKLKLFNKLMKINQELFFVSGNRKFICEV